MGHYLLTVWLIYPTLSGDPTYFDQATACFSAQLAWNQRALDWVQRTGLRGVVSVSRCEPVTAGVSLTVARDTYLTGFKERTTHE